jgi:hypothetical protein
MCLPVGPDAVRLITAEYGADTTGLPTAVTWEETRATVERLTGSPLPAARPRWMQRYRDRTVLADRYRQGRVLIAGDAAHTVFPLNGQALTTALHDVVNLGWKLAAVSRRQVPEELLDTYESERRPVALHVVDSIAAQVSLSKQPEQVRALRESLAGLIELDEVNRRLLDQVMGLGIAYDPHPAAAASMSPLVGRALPLLELKTSGTTVSLAELLRTGRGLLLDFSSGTAVTAAADAWSDRLDLVTAEPPSVLDARAVLLRPDGYVCWAWDSEPEGEASAGLRDALTHWFG